MFQLFFIIGVGRSGTTLLQSMLNAHPNVVCPAETHFVRRYVIPQIKNKSPFKTGKEVLEILEKDEKLKRLDINLEKAVGQVNFEDPLYFRDIFINILQQVAGKEKDIIWIGDKDPMNSRYLKFIKKAFPEARIIHIVRDPRDVILSRIKTPWGRKMPFAAHVCEYHYTFKTVKNQGPGLFNDQYLECSYEKLIQDLEKELKSVCNFLDLDYNQKMLEYYKRSDRIISSDEKKWKENVSRPVMKKNVNKWRDELSNWQIAMIEGSLLFAIKEKYELSSLPAFLRYCLAIPVKVCSFFLKMKEQF